MASILPTKSRSLLLSSSFGISLLLALGAIIWAWRDDRQAVEHILTTVGSSLRAMDNRLGVISLDREAESRAIAETRMALKRLESLLLQVSEHVLRVAAENGLVPVGEAPQEDEGEVTGSSATIADSTGLPPLPPGTNPQRSLARDVAELLKDELWNPLGKQFDETALVELRVDFARCRARAEVLEAEMYLELVKARSSLRDRADFIVYARGEPYASTPGVLTAAESTPDGGVRMYYLNRAEFPELYEKRSERDEVAPSALRRFLKRLEEQ